MSGATLLITLLLSPAAALPGGAQPAPPGATHEARAEALVGWAPEDEPRLAALAIALTRGTTSELEKAEAIYRWVAHNIEYDVAGLVALRATAPTVPEVLDRGVALCGGYAELFRRIAQASGLEARTIIGYAKAYGYEQGSSFRGPNHAWNAVKLDGEWHLLDVTWGAGRIDDLTFVRGYDRFWFLTPAEVFVFSHLPMQPEWQLLRKPLSLEQFEAQPAVTPAQFGAGFRPEYVRALLANPRFPGIPDVFSYGGRALRIHNVPLERELAPGGARQFRLEVDGASDVVVVNDGVWHRLGDVDGVFSGRVPLVPGDLTVNARFPERGDVYWPVLVYRVAGP